MMNDRPERSFDWNDTIENDSSFVLLPAGDYDFTVTKFERARHQPGPNSKLPPCNKAVLTLEVTDGQQRTSVTHNLFLHSRCEGMLCEFFTAIGQRKHGEPLRMDWSKVLGAHGRCKVGVRDWIGRDGQTMQSRPPLPRRALPPPPPATRRGIFKPEAGRKGGGRRPRAVSTAQRASAAAKPTTAQRAGVGRKGG